MNSEGPGRCTMIQSLGKNWLLLAVCSVLHVIISFIYFDHAQGFRWRGDIVLLGRLTLAAGACAILAGAWTSTKNKCWLLVLNGLALGALGLVFGVSDRISFLTVS